MVNRITNISDRDRFISNHCERFDRDQPWLISDSGESVKAKFYLQNDLNISVWRKQKSQMKGGGNTPAGDNCWEIWNPEVMAEK